MSPFAKEGFFPHLALEIFDWGFGSGEKYDKRVGAINSNALRTISYNIVFFFIIVRKGSGIVDESQIYWNAAFVGGKCYTGAPCQ